MILKLSRLRWAYDKKVCTIEPRKKLLALGTPRLSLRLTYVAGLAKMQDSMSAYMKTITKRAELSGKEKALPVAYLGGTMLSHGEDFEPESEFGQCLTSECRHFAVPKWSTDLV